MSGQRPNQMSGQRSNQAGSLLGEQIRNQAGDLMPGQILNMLQSQDMSRNYQMSGQLQNPVVSQQSMGPHIQRARRYIMEKLYEFFMKHPLTPVLPQSKMLEFVNRLEQGLFRNASSQDEYMNLDTLANRLRALYRRALLGNNNQQYSHIYPPSSIGTMIPTPGTSQSRVSSLISASLVDNSMGLSNNINGGASGSSNSVNIFPATNGSAACGISGSLSQPEVNGNMVAGAKRMQNQVMPTLGIQSTVVSQPLQQKLHAGGGNSRIVRHLGTHIGSGPISTLQNSYGISSGDLNGGVANNVQLMNIPATPERCITVTMSGNSARQLGQLQQPLSQDNNAFGPSQLSSNLGSQLKSDADSDSYTEATRSQALEQLQVSNIPSQVLQNSLNFDSRNSQWQSLPSGPQISNSTLNETSQQIPQMLHQDQFLAKIPSDSIYPSRSVRDDAILQSQWYPKPQDESHATVNFPSKSDVQQKYFHRMTGLDETRKLNVPSYPSINGQLVEAPSEERLNISATHLKAYPHSDSDSRCSAPLTPSKVATKSGLQTSPVVDENAMDLEPSPKRVKIVHSLQNDVSETETKVELNSVGSKNHVLLEPVERQSNTCVLLKSQTKDIKLESTSIGGKSPKSNELNSKNLDGSRMQRPNTDPCMPNSAVVFAQQESIKFEKEESEVKQESISVPLENKSAFKSGKPKVKGVSLVELFTPEQVHEHVQSLRPWSGQSKAKVEKNQAMGAKSENSCQLCAAEKLTFEPPPITCSTCGGWIKKNAMYYTIGAGDSHHLFCIHCHNKARGGTIKVEKTLIPKARLEKKKNDKETEEWWVQCDKCEAWQHQICALFNGRRNDGGEAEYTCPNCYILEVERGERMPLPQSAVLGAKDLPRTILSDHIENRLAGKLKQERHDRANYFGKSFDEVPGADGIVVRVVSAVDKKLEVKPQFLEIFKEEDYPSEFPYRSKVVLFFQNIEGVDVCLFGMYVQEFGSECKKPNNRRVYLSYLDSVKYFRPRIKTISGESLRTYVYHEILIGYLEYCKMRGFASCYIWASPPLKGDDYILYCHPKIQKTPKSDKLREWYLLMLRKASRENLVIARTNLYDHFFVTTGECRAKVTAARLPYFDGDYWPDAAEDMISQLRQEEGGKQRKNGSLRKTITKRALKAAGQTDLSGNVSKDLMLMHKLGERIYAMREDFIMVHLQYSCTHCCILMVSGNRWACNSCKTFNLCDKCYEAELKREDRERHPVKEKFKHPLYLVEIKDVANDTKDEDDIIESDLFDTRHAFLSLCQRYHYQYDTLRRAKHSSMMVLYHLHNPKVAPFVTQCVVCHLDIETGQGWRCDTCPDYDLCNACYLKGGGVSHPHKLTNNWSMADVNAQSKEARQSRVTTSLKEMLKLMVHASQCPSAKQCNYPHCGKFRLFLFHGIQCKVTARGGCESCKRILYLLQLHARACKESHCNLPRCRKLKEHLKTLQQQSDSRRRAAVMEMMRQRAAEVAGSSG